MARCIYKGCEFDAWDKDPDGLCIYHSRREDKKEEFWRAFWDGKPQERPAVALNKFIRKDNKGNEYYNFKGFVFPDMDFHEIEFVKPAHFSEATFSGEANFLRATFSGRAYFSEATFSGRAHFSGTKFSGKAYFSEARFSGEAHFSEATFSGEARFLRTTFSGPLLFRETIIKGECIFKQTDFLASAVFERCDLNEGHLILDSAFMAEPEKVNFRLFDENAQHLAFVNISVNTLRGIGFVGMNFLRDGRIYTEDYLKTQGDYSDSGRLNKAGLELALSAYRGLRLNYEDNGLFPEARHFYIREMELKRELEIYPNYWLIKDFWKNFCSYIGLLWVYGVWHGHFWRWVRYEVFSLQSWYHRISSCGESYRKAFVWLMGLYLVCGILYWIGGLTVRDRGETFAANPFIFSLKSLIPGFYMILGVPENPWKAALMFAEGVLGLVIITLFLLAVRRRFKR